LNISRITVKGQTTIPIQIRKFLGISPHDLVSFRVFKMKEIYIDANVFLRFILGEPPEFAVEAERVFRDSIEGRFKLVTSELVLAEIVWTLEAFQKVF